VHKLVEPDLNREYLLDEPIKLAVYRIAQEQCTNIIKYTKAKNATINLMTIDDMFTVIIEDDAKKGIGCAI
jgi:signal transduction histidine kinase